MISLESVNFQRKTFKETKIEQVISRMHSDRITNPMDSLWHFTKSAGGSSSQTSFETLGSSNLTLFQFSPPQFQRYSINMIQDFRYFSFMASLYRLITMSFSEYLYNVLLDIISSSQVALSIGKKFLMQCLLLMRLQMRDQIYSGLRKNRIQSRF